MGDGILLKCSAGKKKLKNLFWRKTKHHLQLLLLGKPLKKKDFTEFLKSRALSESASWLIPRHHLPWFAVFWKMSFKGPNLIFFLLYQSKVHHQSLDKLIDFKVGGFKPAFCLLLVSIVLLTVKTDCCSTWSHIIHQMHFTFIKECKKLRLWPLELHDIWKTWHCDMKKSDFQLYLPGRPTELKIAFIRENWPR